MNNNTLILLIILILFLLFVPILAPLISFVVVAGIIIVLTFLLYMSISGDETKAEMYSGSNPNNPSDFAAMFQEVPLPSSDELSEEGGGYDIAEGIQSPMVSRKDDPWLFPKISWGE